jgi:transposase
MGFQKKGKGGPGRNPYRERGRPTVLTDELSERICGYVRRGNYLETAAACSGISKDTLFRWLREGARDSLAGKVTDLSRFSDSINAASAKSEITLLGIIRRAALGSNFKDPETGAVKIIERGQWQAAAWTLERTKPDKFALKTKSELEAKHEVTGKDGSPLAGMSSAELLAVFEKVRASSADAPAIADDDAEGE